MGKHFIHWAVLVVVSGIGLIRVTTRTVAGAGDAIQRAGVGACDPASPDDVFRDKGLTKVGFLLVIPQEADVHTATTSVRSLKSKVVSESLARTNMARAVQTSSDILDKIGADLVSMDAQMEKLKGNTTEYNKRVGSYNATLKQFNLRKAQLEDLRKKQAKIEDSQSLYNEAVVTSARKADEAMALYADLAKDAAIKAAIETANKGTAQPVKLGPSGILIADAAFLKKCLADLTADGVPIRIEGGVPVVDVVIHGKKHDMIWDSGAAFVSFSAETAADFGLKATDQDQTVKTVIADGSTVENKLITVPLITVGGFTAENVECIIAPPGKNRAGDLLGGTFQRHFLCRLDQQAGVLHLTPIDVPAAVARAIPSAEKPAPKPTPGDAADAPRDKPSPPSANAGAPNTGNSELKKALLASKWGWYTHDVLMTFHEDGTVEHGGMHGTYEIQGSRKVILHIANGDTMTLTFNADLTHYTSVGRGFGGDRYAE